MFRLVGYMFKLTWLLFYYTFTLLIIKGLIGALKWPIHMLKRAAKQCFDKTVDVIKS